MLPIHIDAARCSVNTATIPPIQRHPAAAAAANAAAAAAAADPTFIKWINPNQETVQPCILCRNELSYSITDLLKHLNVFHNILKDVAGPIYYERLQSIKKKKKQNL